MTKKGTFLLESVGLEPTHNPPTPIFFRGIQRLYRLSYDSDTRFFPTMFFTLTITLMIRMTTDLIPSRFLTYKELLKALPSLMVIAYIIMIRKLIQKRLQGPSTGFGFQVQQGVIATTLA